MGTDVGKVGLMMKSLYGRRDAASNWERDWQVHVRTGDFKWDSVRRICSTTKRTECRVRHANKETDGVREEDDERWVVEEHQNVEHEVSEESCINTIPDTLTCL